MHKPGKSQAAKADAGSSQQDVARPPPSSTEEPHPSPEDLATRQRSRQSLPKDDGESPLKRNRSERTSQPARLSAALDDSTPVTASLVASTADVSPIAFASLADTPQPMPVGGFFSTGSGRRVNISAASIKAAEARLKLDLEDTVDANSTIGININDTSQPSHHTTIDTSTDRTNSTEPSRFARTRTSAPRADSEPAGASVAPDTPDTSAPSLTTTRPLAGRSALAALEGPSRRSGLRTPFRTPLAGGLALLPQPNQVPTPGGRRSFNAPKASLRPPTTSEATAPAQVLAHVHMPDWLADSESSIDISTYTDAEAETIGVVSSGSSAEVTELFGKADDDELSLEQLRGALLSLGCHAPWCQLEKLANTYRWVVWKALSAVADDASGQPNVVPLNILVGLLLLRYNDEYVDGRRSAFRLITEQDASAARPYVCFVSRVLQPSSVSCRIELSDGYYALQATLDAPLSRLVYDGTISEGSKLLACGSTFSGTDGQDPLQAYTTATLTLSSNGTRPAAADAALGFVCSNTDTALTEADVFATPAGRIDLNGGIIPCIEGTVTRILAPVYIETNEKGQRTARNQHAEAVRQDEFEKQRYEEYERLAAKHDSHVAGTMMAEAGQAMRDVFATQTFLVDDGSGEVVGVQLWRNIEVIAELRVGTSVRVFNLIPARHQNVKPPLHRVKMLSMQARGSVQPLKSKAIDSGTSSAIAMAEVLTIGHLVENAEELRGELVDIFVELCRVDTSPQSTCWLSADDSSGMVACIRIEPATLFKQVTWPMPSIGYTFCFASVLFQGVREFDGVTTAVFAAQDFSQLELRPSTRCHAAAARLSAASQVMAHQRQLVMSLSLVTLPHSIESGPVMPTAGFDAPSTLAVAGERSANGRSPTLPLDTRPRAALYGGPIRPPPAASQQNLKQTQAHISLPAPVRQMTTQATQTEVQSFADAVMQTERAACVHGFAHVHGVTLRIGAPLWRDVDLFSAKEQGPSVRMTALVRPPLFDIEASPDAKSFSQIAAVTNDAPEQKADSSSWFAAEVTVSLTDRSTYVLTENAVEVFAAFPSPEEVLICASTDDYQLLPVVRTRVLQRIRQHCVTPAGSSDAAASVWLRVLACSVVVSSAVWNHLRVEISASLSLSASSNASAESQDRSEDEISALMSELAKLRRWNSAHVAPRDVIWWHSSEWEAAAQRMASIRGVLLKVALHDRGGSGGYTLLRCTRVADVNFDSLLD
jgi:hypothetical protein